MKEITARLWENQKYGTTYGKGQYRKAIYNGTLELANPTVKYLVDFEEIADWFHFAKSQLHQAITAKIQSIPENEQGVLMSWLYRYDGGIKIPTGGYAALDLNTMRIQIQIDDENCDLSEHWELPVRSCIARIPGKPTPNLIATTLAELVSTAKPPQKPSIHGAFFGGAKHIHKGALHRV